MHAIYELRSCTLLCAKVTVENCADVLCSDDDGAGKGFVISGNSDRSPHIPAASSSTQRSGHFIGIGIIISSSRIFFIVSPRSGRTSIV